MNENNGQARVSKNRGDVLVLGNYRHTLVVTRSLARAGYGVVVVNDRDDGKREFVEFSKSVSRVWRLPACRDDASFIDALVAYLKGPGSGVKYVFPVGEISLRNLAEASARFENLATLVMPKAETALLCLDKRRIYERAQALGIPVAPWSDGEDRGRWKRKAVEYGFPVVIKRKNSFALVREKKAVIIGTESALDDFLKTLADDPDPSSLLLQKFVSGERRNCNIAAVDGKITAILETRTLRTDAADGTGYGVDVATVAVSEDLRRHCEALVADLRYTGIGMIQFLIDPANSAPSLLEINPRLGALAALPMFAGYDFPLMAVECAADKGVGPVPGSTAGPSYPVDMRAYWLYGDILGLLRHARRQPPLESLRWGGRILLALCTHRRHVTWRWDDPLPTAYLYLALATELAGGLRRRLARLLGSSD
jgi:biotin carboxylase